MINTEETPGTWQHWGGNQKFLERLWKCANENLTRDEISNKLLLATGGKEKTIQQVAMKNGKLGVLQNIWEWPEGNLTEREINYKLLLVADDKERTIWQVAADQDILTILQKMREWAKRHLTREEMLHLGVVNQDEHE